MYPAKQNLFIEGPTGLQDDEISYLFDRLNNIENSLYSLIQEVRELKDSMVSQEEMNQISIPPQPRYQIPRRPRAPHIQKPQWRTHPYRAPNPKFQQPTVRSVVVVPNNKVPLKKHIRPPHGSRSEQGPKSSKAPKPRFTISPIRTSSPNDEPQPSTSKAVKDQNNHSNNFNNDYDELTDIDE